MKVRFTELCGKDGEINFFQQKKLFQFFQRFYIDNERIVYLKILESFFSTLLL